MRRLKALCLAPSHSTYYRKLDQYGKDHDSQIKQKVKVESERLQTINPITVNVAESTVSSILPSQTDSAVSKEMAGACVTQSGVQTCSSNLGEAHESSSKECFGQSMGTPTSFNTSDVGRKIVLDNIDYHQATHHMTQSQKDPDLHFCTHMSTENRVSGNHLSDGRPIADIMGMENGVVIPSEVDNTKQRCDYIVLVSRYITEELQCLKFLSNATIPHIQHQYSHEMKKKTETVGSCCKKRYARGSAQHTSSTCNLDLYS